MKLQAGHVEINAIEKIPGAIFLKIHFPNFLDLKAGFQDLLELVLLLEM